MNNRLDRKVVLDAMISHETITVTDLTKPENLGMTPDVTHLRYLLEELRGSGYLKELQGVSPLTYTITEKGIEEGVRLRNMETREAGDGA